MLSSSFYHSCGLCADNGEAVCWGGNFDGQLATIFAGLPPKTARQTLLFSATISDSIEAIRQGCRDEGRPEPFVWQGTSDKNESKTVSQLDQRIVLTPPSDDAKAQAFLLDTLLGSL